MSRSDLFNLARFTFAQDPVFDGVLAELREGRKRSHWMWFIFPQLHGLGFSSTAKFYAIKSEAEARSYLSHPVLGPRLLQCVEIVLGLEGGSAEAALGTVDAMKLRSSATLFAHVAGPHSVFARLLTRYFEGKPDVRTLQLLGGAAAPDGEP